MFDSDNESESYSNKSYSRNRQSNFKLQKDQPPRQTLSPFRWEMYFKWKVDRMKDEDKEAETFMGNFPIGTPEMPDHETVRRKSREHQEYVDRLYKEFPPQIPNMMSRKQEKHDWKQSDSIYYIKTETPFQFKCNMERISIKIDTKMLLWAILFVSIAITTGLIIDYHFYGEM